MNLFYRAGRDTKTFALDGRERATIGRSSSCDLVISDRSVSRVHATVVALEDQHLLSDSGSANGTFLNGLRLDGSTLVVLREGDVIEIGGVRFIYGAEGRVPAPTRSEGGVELIDTPLPLEDLLRDGHARVPEESGNGRFVAALSTGDRARGLERCLRLVLEDVNGALGALFLAHEIRGIVPVALVPNADAVTHLIALAHRAWERREARLVRAIEPEDLPSSRDTVSDVVQSSCAVPFGTGERLVGVIAVARDDDPCLDRSDLATIAALGERLANVLTLRRTAAGDTRGFD